MELGKDELEALAEFKQELLAPGHEAGGSKDEEQMASVNTDRIWWLSRYEGGAFCVGRRKEEEKTGRVSAVVARYIPGFTRRLTFSF